jgi:hypothetical protein
VNVVTAFVKRYSVSGTVEVENNSGHDRAGDADAVGCRATLADAASFAGVGEHHPAPLADVGCRLASDGEGILDVSIREWIDAQHVLSDSFKQYATMMLLVTAVRALVDRGVFSFLDAPKK